MRSLIGFLVGAMVSSTAIGGNFPKVDADLAVYDRTIVEMRETFAKRPVDPLDFDWVKAKIDNMFEMDQFMRRFDDVVKNHQYTPEEKEYFDREFFLKRFHELDRRNTSDIKELLQIYPWFRISVFGEKTDNRAWNLVQHADLDPEFQKNVLVRLEMHYPRGETRPANYAYLYDRVAASWYDPAKRTLQRYGTQGDCIDGEWRELPIEDPANLDARRAAMGMISMAEYRKQVKDAGLCK